MAKKFEKWLDEFVEQGANPGDVTNWPEEAGGGSYTAGNGITITDENVISADVKTLQVYDIESLTNEQCEELNIGDVVISSDVAYVVNYKQNSTTSRFNELDLVFVTNYEIRKVIYQKSQGSDWQYVDTDEKNLDLFNLVFLHGHGGTITDADDISAIVDHAFIELNAKTILLPTYAEDIPQGTVYHYSSAVYQDNKYVECAVVVATGYTQATYQVEEKTIGGSNGHHIELYGSSGRIDLTVLEKITYDYEPYEDSYIVLYLDLQSPLGSDVQEEFKINCYPNRYLSSGESSLVNFQSVDGMYNIVLEYTYDDNTGEINGAGYTVHSGAQLHHIVVRAHQDDPYVSLMFTMMCDDLSITTYNDLIQYLVGKGMIGVKLPDEPTIKPAMAINPCEGSTNSPVLINSICTDGTDLIVNYNDVYISSNQVVVGTGTVIVPNNENFNIYHLNDGNFWHRTSKPGE